MGQPSPHSPVILTRPRGRNERLAAALQAQGLAVLQAPALGIDMLDTPRPLPSAGDLCLFVSRQAVDAYFSRPPGAWPAQAWAGAVGGATAQALRAHVPPDCILAPDAGHAPDSESLLALIDARGLQPARVHILRAEQGRDWLAQQLQLRGAQVHCHALYRRSALLWDQATAAALAQAPDCILLLTSLEALDAIDISLHHHGLGWPERLQLVTLHARIARRLQYIYAARPAGALGVTLSAPDETALFQAILAASRPPRRIRTPS